MHILLTGATGLVGKALGIRLVQAGHTLTVISRDPKKAKNICPFPAQFISWQDSLPLTLDSVIHLAGENVADKNWSPAQKQKLTSSRVETTQKLVSSLKNICTLKTFISASAIGFYGDTGKNTVDESSPKGAGFLAQLCEAWETEALKFSYEEKNKPRTVILRIGVILSAQGGALSKMLPAFKLGFGGKIGSEKKSKKIGLSWIHLEDLVNVILESLGNEKYEGIINAVSPTPTNNSTFTDLICEAFHFKAFLTIPTPALKLKFGEMASIMLGSQNVVSSKLKSLNFQYRYPDLKNALIEIASWSQFQKKSVSLVFEQQYLDQPIETVFAFFSSPCNLEKITPPFLNFKILCSSTAKVEKNTLIDYQLHLHGIPFHWKTKITDFKDDQGTQKSFVDFQEKGPYRLWQHEHTFEKIGTGTLVRDWVRYEIPLGKAGMIAAGWKVDADVSKIFDYRREHIAKLI